MLQIRRFAFRLALRLAGTATGEEAFQFQARQQQAEAKLSYPYVSGLRRASHMAEKLMTLVKVVSKKYWPTRQILILCQALSPKRLVLSRNAPKMWLQTMSPACKEL
jgi:hypothetical protein